MMIEDKEHLALNITGIDTKKERAQIEGVSQEAETIAQDLDQDLDLDILGTEAEEDLTPLEETEEMTRTKEIENSLAIEMMKSDIPKREM